MKFLKTFLLLTLTILTMSKKFIPEPSHLVVDRRPQVAELSHIVRTNPTITTNYKYGYPSVSRPSNRLSFSNNNDNNAPNLGGYGKTAIIASNISC